MIISGMILNIEKLCPLLGPSQVWLTRLLFTYIFLAINDDDRDNICVNYFTVLNKSALNRILSQQKSLCSWFSILLVFFTPRLGNPLSWEPWTHT